MAYDFAFDFKNLSRELRKEDIRRYGLFDSAQKDAIIRNAIADAANGLPRVHFLTHNGARNTTFQLALISQELVFRN